MSRQKTGLVQLAYLYLLRKPMRAGLFHACSQRGEWTWAFHVPRQLDLVALESGAYKIQGDTGEVISRVKTALTRTRTL